MISHKEVFPTESIMVRAVQAVEAQQGKRFAAEGEEAKKKREEFFEFLDQSSDAIFAGIEKAASKGERIYFPGYIPGFHEECDKICGIGLGSFDPELFQDWLRLRNFSQNFRVHGQRAIEW